MCQSKMFDPPAPSDMALGEIQVARRRPRPVSLGSEALGYRAMLEVWV